MDVENFTENINLKEFYSVDISKLISDLNIDIDLINANILNTFDDKEKIDLLKDLYYEKHKLSIFEIIKNKVS